MATVEESALEYLRDHAVFGWAMLPGSAYMEIGIALARRATGSRAVRVDDLRFREALFVSDATLALELTFAPDSGEFSVATDAVHAEGRVAALEDPPPPPVDLRSVRARCPKESSGEQHYAAVGARGAAYGPAFQGLRRLFSADGESLGFIELPQGARGDGRYELHPALLDACVQVGAGSFGLHEGLYLPTSVDRLRIWGDVPDTVWSHVVLSDRRSDPREVDGTVALLDAEGSCRAELRGVRGRRVRRGRRR